MLYDPAAGAVVADLDHRVGFTGAHGTSDSFQLKACRVLALTRNVRRIQFHDEWVGHDAQGALAPGASDACWETI